MSESLPGREPKQKGNGGHQENRNHHIEADPMGLAEKGSAHKGVLRQE